MNSGTCSSPWFTALMVLFISCDDFGTWWNQTRPSNGQNGSAFRRQYHGHVRNVRLTDFTNRIFPNASETERTRKKMFGNCLNFVATSEDLNGK